MSPGPPPEPAASIAELDYSHPANVAASLMMHHLKRGEPVDVPWYFEQGVNVNCRDLQTGGTLLHIAAAYAARPILRYILKDPATDYLAQDNEGRFASQLALELAGDIALGRLLLKKEVQLAEQRGVRPWPQRAASRAQRGAGQAS